MKTYGFNVWTKNPPRDYIDMFAEYASDKGSPIVGVVDDVLPQVVFGRTQEEVLDYNCQYNDYMRAVGFQDVVFVSAMLQDRDSDLGRLWQMGQRVSLAAFMSLLPERKKNRIHELGLNEAVDTCWQLHVLEEGMAQAGVQSYLTGKRSTALFRLAKSTIDHFEFEVIDE